MKKAFNHQQIVYLCALLVVLINIPTLSSWDQSRYFDTSFLRQHSLVQKSLIADGFKSGYFPTDDGHSLAYLLLLRPNAQHTLIFCAGFWPGKKEGLASFYPLMPNDCNILFFDARGHGASSGTFAKSVVTYGSTEYRDILSAIKFAHEQSDLPIIVHGICSGAFHATHAILDLQKNNLLDAYRVQGLVFDSGWNDIWVVAKSALRSELTQGIQSLLSRTGTSFASICARMAGLGLNITHLVLTPLYRITPHRNPLDRVISQLAVPMLYIHMKDDSYSAFEPVEKLAAITPQATCWWITQPSKHACHHLKYKHEYRERLTTFIHKAL